MLGSVFNTNSHTMDTYRNVWQTAKAEVVNCTEMSTVPTAVSSQTNHSCIYKMSSTFAIIFNNINIKIRACSDTDGWMS